MIMIMIIIIMIIIIIIFFITILSSNLRYPFFTDLNRPPSADSYPQVADRSLTSDFRCWCCARSCRQPKFDFTDFYAQVLGSCHGCRCRPQLLAAGA